MKKSVLDTNFILACIKQKIDFLEEIRFMGIGILIPEEVIGELRKISEAKKKKLHFREDAKTALKLLEKSRDSFEKIQLNEKQVDKGLIKFANENREVIVATLDRELKSKIKNPKIVIREKKKLEII